MTGKALVQDIGGPSENRKARALVRDFTPQTDVSQDDFELAVPLQTVCFIAARAHDLMGKAASTSSETEDDDIAADVLEDRGNDPVEHVLRSLIADLDDEAQVDLVALMWLGRDDDDWRGLRDLAWQERTTPTADYLLGTPLLADYLLAGLNRLGLDCSRTET